MPRRLRLLLLLCAALALPAAAQQERVLRMAKPAPKAVASPEQRIALVIGNALYKEAPLLNPVNDARAIAKALTRSGFKVVLKENIGRAEMQVAVREFGDALKTGGVGLFYFAGHGVQVKGRNFLIPVDAIIEREDEVAYNSLDANQVLDKMETASNRLNIVILDACRNNPFARSFRSSGAGLAQMEAPVGTFIAFATAPGSVASDGKDKNGLYTQHLLRAMLRPGLRIEDVFKEARAGVRRDSQGRQVPWENTSLEGDFIFVPKPPAKAASVAAPGPQKKIERIDAPRLTVGDSWTYQTIDLLSGSVKRNYTVSLSEIGPDTWRFGTGFVTDKSWNVLRETTDGKPVKWTPKRPNYDFPLELGKTWAAVAVRDTPDRETEHSFTFRVVRQERVIVPAGTFDTFRIEGTNRYKARKKQDGSTTEGGGVHRYWYSPVVARFVAYEYDETNSKGVVHIKDRTELVSHKRGGKPQERPRS